MAPPIQTPHDLLNVGYGLTNEGYGLVDNTAGFGRYAQTSAAQLPSWYRPINPGITMASLQEVGLPTNQVSPLPPPDTGINWLGKDGVLIPGLNAFSNLSNAITGYQQLGLAKEAFDFNKRLTETNLANQARTTNADIIARERSQLRQRGGNQIPNLDQLARIRSQDRLVKGTL